ncbi:tripartite tricarboxylate transporter substrate-binding protein [Variovorax sp. J22R115]|uniref:tripartite tricarboxylate transporter substrate-binding protein n=1 Tax=Variovorax sp. J22R115 TaxID=3053509 RepID=UPI0025790CDC|nr:tripartite tricarboxylate transporter substrate-binding protein [Variovorax sp. J22R115]MDM0051393.1 tripartite tricarboxylate transporter substrate-binding protein [Variovorax sp. J22R115]
MPSSVSRSTLTPGVGGTLGLAAVARAAPDGYTLLMSSTTTMSIAPQIFNQRPSNPRAAFVPVALVSLLPCGVAENSSTPVPDLQSHIEWLKNSGGKVDGIYAPPGTPGAIVDKLADAIRRIVRTDDVRAQLVKQDVDLVLLTGPAARVFLDQEDESRAAAVRA